jgi:hypothetical protein
VVSAITDLGFGFKGFFTTTEAWHGNSMLGGINTVLPEEFVDGLS